MAISRILGASLVSDLDRQGVDLQFTTSGNSLVYMDFANFRMGVNTVTPSQSLEVNGNLLVSNGHLFTNANLSYDLGTTTNWFRNVYANTITARSFTANTLTGTLLTNAQPNITSLGSLTGLNVAGNIAVTNFILPSGNVAGSIGSTSLYWGSMYANLVYAQGYYGTILTGQQPNISNLANVTIGNLTVSGKLTTIGNVTFNTVLASALYDSNVRVMTQATTITVNGDVTGSGTYSNIYVSLPNTGVTAGVYGSADDETWDRIPKITVDSKGRITNIANILLTQVGNVSFNNTTISSASGITVQTANNGNIYLNANGTGTVQITGSDAVWLPAGDSSQRPAYPEIGYFRYNTDVDSIEYWDGVDWVSPGVQPISSQVLTPNGLSDTFTLTDNATAESLLVMINGTLQQPSVAYTVTGNQITFSEIPLTSDVIEIRRIASGATTVGGLSLGSTTITLTAGNVNVAGNLIPTENVAYDIGTSDLRWKDLWLAGSTIRLGNVILKESNGNLRIRNSEDSADAVIEATLDATSVTQGNIQIGTNHIESINTNGPISIRPNGIGEVGLFSNTIVVGRGGDASIVTGANLPDQYGVDFPAGNINLAPGGSKVINLNANTFVTGSITSSTLIGNVTGRVTGNVTGNLTGNVTGNLTGNVTGNLTGNVTGNLTGNLTGNVTGNVTGNLTGNVTGNVTGTILTASQPNITTVGNITALSVAGNTTIYGNLTVRGTQTIFNTNNASFTDGMVYYADGNSADVIDLGFVTAFTDAVRYQHSGLVRDASDNGTWKLFANVVTEPTTVVNFTNATYANLKIGNLSVGSISATSDIITAAGTKIGLGTTPSYTLDMLSDSDGRIANFKSTGRNAHLALLNSANNYYVQGMTSASPIDTPWAISGTGSSGVDFHLVVGGVYNSVLKAWAANSQVEISGTTASTTTSTGAFRVMGGMGVAGNLNVGGTNNQFGGNIVPTTSNTSTLGSSTSWFVTTYSTAVQAQYADLAENYESDADYAPGTVVIFGGDKEITISTQSHDSAVAGVISTNPAYWMNKSLENGLPVALQGRVPCQVCGPIRKGQLVTTSNIAGVGQRLDTAQYQIGCIIGKALQDITDHGINTIEVVVGRL